MLELAEAYKTAWHEYSSQGDPTKALLAVSRIGELRGKLYEAGFTEEQIMRLRQQVKFEMAKERET